MTELLDASQIAELTGYKTKTVHYYRQRDAYFPRPVKTVRRCERGPETALFRKSEVLQWFQQRKQFHYQRSRRLLSRAMINNRAGLNNDLAVGFLSGQFSCDAGGIFIRRKRAAMNKPKTTTVHLSSE